MTHESTPILNFVAARYQTPVVQRIVESWRVEPHVIIDRVVEHFRDMGIYMVPAGQEQLIADSMLFLLRTSPDLMRIVVKAHNEEIRRSRNRHAD